MSTMDPDNKIIAERIVAAIEGRFRDWLMPGEYAEAVELVTKVLNEEGKSLK